MNTNKCGTLQLQIDLSKENRGEKIKIHGIFPNKGVDISSRRKIQVSFFDNYQDEYIYDKIEARNFLSFFDNITALFDNSVDKHLKHTIQDKNSFINNTIFLSEAIMLKLKSREVKDMDWYITTLKNLPPIWGYNHFDDREGEDKIKIYFKVCFNTVKNIWQFCNSDYIIPKSTDGLSNNEIIIKKSIRRKKSVRRSKSIKKSRRRSRRRSKIKSRNKSVKKSKRRSIKKSRMRPRMKSVYKSVKKSRRRSKKSFKKSRRVVRSRRY
jgi:hypothetical protein